MLAVITDENLFQIYYFFKNHSLQTLQKFGRRKKHIFNEYLNEFPEIRNI